MAISVKNTEMVVYWLILVKLAELAKNKRKYLTIIKINGIN